MLVKCQSPCASVSISGGHSRLHHGPVAGLPPCGLTYPGGRLSGGWCPAPPHWRSSPRAPSPASGCTVSLDGPPSPSPWPAQPPHAGLTEDPQCPCRGTSGPRVRLCDSAEPLGGARSLPSSRPRPDHPSPALWGTGGSHTVPAPCPQAFRQLSHRFHGKGSGKMKTERRMKKLDEEAVGGPWGRGVASAPAGAGVMGVLGPTPALC